MIINSYFNFFNFSIYYWLTCSCLEKTNKKITKFDRNTVPVLPKGNVDIVKGYYFTALLHRSTSIKMR